MRRLNNDLRAGPGDRVRGKELFGKHCATCHKLFGEGGEIGPDLTGTARGDTPALLANIVDPGALVRTPYLQYAAVTISGRIVSGLLVAQDGAGVTLVDAQNQRTTLPRDDDRGAPRAAHLDHARKPAQAAQPPGGARPVRLFARSAALNSTGDSLMITPAPFRWFGLSLFVLTVLSAARAGEPGPRVYENRLTPLSDPKPLLADHPEFVEPVRERARFEAPLLVDDADADLHVRAWRFSYNARGIIEMPNRLRAAETALIMVHPWGIDDGQGWKTPEPNGVCDFCTPAKNALAARHTREVVNPFLHPYPCAGEADISSLRGQPAHDLCPYPAAAARDQRHLACQPVRDVHDAQYTRPPTRAEGRVGCRSIHSGYG